MKAISDSFTNLLKKMNISYRIVADSNNDKNTSDLIGITTIKGNSGLTYNIGLAIDDACVSANIFLITDIPKTKYNMTLKLINKINSTYRWITFYISKSNSLTAHIDGVLPIYDCSAGAEICYELMIRLFKTVDETYPMFAKLLHE
ncbi:MAG: hypothetical protein SOZ34_11070 [Clostridia bacterium]|nr:hypothetical protein [Clostridia bacterium]